MSDNKVYYWLKLKNNFFEDDTIQWIEEQKNGKDYIIFYLKLALKSLADDGNLIRYVGEKLIPYDITALARLTNTSPDTVAVAMKLFTEIGLVAKLETGEIYLNQIDEMIGKETRQANIMRKKRAKVNQIKRLAQTKENHIPYIEGYTNKTRYGGSYYNVFNRDEQQCLSCGNKDNLCVHHIIGFDENDNKTTLMGSMITLCRGCHSKEHANPRSIVNDDILGKISFDFSLYERIDSLTDTHGRSNKVTRSYPDVKTSYTEIEKDLDLELDLDLDSELKKEPGKPDRFVEQVIDYLNEKINSNFKTKTKQTRDLINGRISEGYTLDDFKYVIDIKYDDWFGNKEMQKNLRPSTLFRPGNFENYINQKRVLTHQEEQLLKLKTMRENREPEYESLPWGGVENDER